MRCPHRANHARRAARCTNAFQIQRHQHRLRINADETYIERVTEAMNWIAILLRIREKLRNAYPKIITQSRLALFLRIGVAQNTLRCCGHSRYTGDVFRPGAPLIFVRAPEHDWLNRQTASQK